MAADSPIPLIGDAFFEWREKYPQAADDLIKLVNLIYGMELRLVTPGATTQGTAIIPAKTNFLLALPLKFTRTIADSTATAASVSTQLNLLLAELRKTGQLPS